MRVTNRRLQRALAEGRRILAVKAYQKRFQDPDCIDCRHKPRSDSDYSGKRNCRYCRGEEDE